MTHAAWHMHALQALAQSRCTSSTSWALGYTTLSAVPPRRLPLYTVLLLQACYAEPDCPVFLKHITIL